MMRAGVVVALWSAWPLSAKPQGRGQDQEPRQEQEARQKLIGYLDGIAQSQLDARKRSIAQIQTRADAERRKAIVREKILT
jgi:cytochrome c1